MKTLKILLNYITKLKFWVISYISKENLLYEENSIQVFKSVFERNNSKIKDLEGRIIESEIDMQNH